ncbi:MAG: hypothetical protein ACKVYV_01195 [Limisphaerales bacterium]
MKPFSRPVGRRDSPPDVNRLRILLLAAGISCCGWPGGLFAQPVPVPNGSFELPATQFVDTRMDAWQEAPKPPEFDEGGGFLWDQLTGVFRNTPPGSPDHIDNCDGLQAAYFFAVPGVGFFQDYDSVDWNDPEPSRAFDARFEAGKSYTLTFGVVAGGGNMLEGVSFEAALYYRDGSGTNQAVVSATNVVFTRAAFPTRTTLTEVTLRTPFVRAGDPWAGRHIGIRFLSTVSDGMKGGYWDLDHLRLVAEGPGEITLRTGVMDGKLQVRWPSVAGYRYQLERSTGLDTWSEEGAAQPGTGGALAAEVPLAGPPPAFFRVLATPGT